MNVIKYLQKLYIRRTPRFVSLGQEGGNMYFIDCYNGKIYRLHKDYQTDFEVISTIMEIGL